MADLKISQLTDGGNSQATDEYVVARSGANYRIDGASVAAAATSVGTLSSLTVSGDLTVDTSTLKVDSTANSVGIGTTTLKTYSGYNSLTLGNNGSGGILAFRSSYNSGNGAEIYQNSSGILLFNINSALTGMALDASGNLGLGVTPSAFGSAFKAFQITSLGAIWANTSGLFISNNVYNDGAGNKYIGSATATRYYQLTGQHVWETAASGTAGNAITFTQAMTLDASGNLTLAASQARLIWTGTNQSNISLSSYDSDDNEYAAISFIANSGGGTMYFRSAAGTDPGHGSSDSRLSVSSTGLVTVPGTLKAATTVGVGNATPSTSGAGITFPATQSASSDANTLDDYEEGTWTTTISSASNLTGTPSLANAKYTKIGRTVFIEGKVTGYSITSASTLTYFVVTVPIPMYQNANVSFCGIVYATASAGVGTVVDNSSANDTQVYVNLPAYAITTTGASDFIISMTYLAAT